MRSRPRLGLVLVMLAIAALVYGLDRWTKAWALANLTPGQPRDFVGSVLRLHLIFNPGAAFSLGTDMTAVFTVVMVVVIGAVLYGITRISSLAWAVTFALVLGGAAGNLTDRLTRPPGFGVGHVVDFLQLPNWPIFNIADSSIVTAAVLAGLLTLLNVPMNRPDPDRPEPATEPQHPESASSSAVPADE